MAKIHITLVGGQPAPVYNCIAAIEPDKVIYIYSENTKKNLNILRQEVHVEEAVQLPPLHPTDPAKIKEQAQSLAEMFRNDEVTVNISSGLKSWSHIFGYVFQALPNATVVYMDQNNVLWDYKTGSSRRNFFHFDMKTMLRLYGNTLERYSSIEDYNDADKNVCNTLQNIRNYNHSQFNELLIKTNVNVQNLNTAYGRIQQDESSSYVEWDKNIVDGHSFVRVKLEGHNEWCLSSPHAVQLAFNAGWFEYKVANILSKWDKVSDIWLNCVFQLKPNIDKNEIDIIVNVGDKLIFVECKTQISKPTDIDKFANVVRVYGGTASKALFVTDAHKSEVAKEKCRENNIIEYSIQEGNDQLINILTQKLYTINER